MSNGEDRDPNAGEQVRRQAALVVGLGASAGGLEPLRQFLDRIPPGSNLIFVVIQHLDPRHPSMLAELLARSASMPVLTAEDGVLPKRGQVYVIAAGTLLRLSGGVFRTSSPAGAGARAPIDVFFRSLADECGERSVGILLSGAGHDGTAGLRAIRERGGLTLAQRPETARHDAMPQSAIEAGFVDHVMAPEQMATHLLEHAGYVSSLRSQTGTIDAELAVRLGEICGLIRQATGHDFSGYREATLLRRIRRRLQIGRLTTVADYVEALKEDHAEAEALVKDLLIGVTWFFRDPEAFEALAHQVVPGILRAHDVPIRVWVAGCASGEEAYSIAILIREHLERIRSERSVQIFATDLDSEMLAEARQGRYPPSIAEQMSPERLARFFVREGEAYQAVQELREMCLFSQHGLTRDPPFSQLDLISCRNVLIYLNPELQKKLVPVFHYALRPGGFLFLGTAEGVTNNPELFETVDKRSRIFRRRETVSRAAVEFPLAPRSLRRSAEVPPAPGPAPRASRTAREVLASAFERLVLDEYSWPCLAVDERGEILLVAGPVARYLQPPAGAFPTNLLDAVRGSLRIELRSALQQAARTGGRVVRDPVTVELEDVARAVRLVVRPISAGQAGSGLFLVVLQERPPHAMPEENGADADLPPAVQALESELQAARTELKATIEDLDSANEEMKSSNEELISTNEELQSANEELQTSKEELQSLNEELETVNTELRQKVDELAAANSDLQNLFAATQIATIFLDRSLRVTKFTPAATLLFHLIDSDVGRPLSDLAPRFAGRNLVSDAEEVLRRLAPVERQVQSAQGAWFALRVLPYRTTENLIAGVVVTFVDVSEIRRAEEIARQQAQLVHLSHDAIFVRRFDGIVESWNRGAQELYGYAPEEAIGRSTHDLMGTVFPKPRPEIDRELRAGGCWAGELRQRTRDGNAISVLSNMQYARGEDGVERILEANRDVTRQKADAHRLAYLASFPENNPNPIVEADVEGRVRYANPAARRLFPDLDERPTSHPWLADWPEAVLRLREGGDVGARTVAVGERIYHQALYLRPDEGLIRTYGLDITERRQAEATRERLTRELGERVGELQALLDSVPVAIWIAHDPGCRSITGNAYASRLIMRTTTDANISHSAPPGEIAVSYRILRRGVELAPEELPAQKAAATGRPVPSEEVELVFADGRSVHMILGAVPLLDSAGSPRGSVTAGIDISDLKAAQEDLRASEAKYRSLFENMAEEVHFWKVVHDERGRIETWRLVDANPPALKTWGKTLEETRGRTTDEIFGPGATEHFMPVVQRILAERAPYSFEDHFPNQDRYFRFTSIPLGDHFITTGADITAIRKALQLASDERAQLEAVIQAVQDGVAVADTSGRFVLVNEAEARINGYANTQEMLRDLAYFAQVYELSLPDGTLLPVEKWPMSRVLRGESIVDLELHARRKDLDREWFFSFAGEPVHDENGVQTLAVVVTRDITERKRAEQVLRESEERFRIMADSSPVIMWLTDEKGGVRFVNRIYREFFGVTYNEVKGGRWQPLIHPEDAPAYIDAFTDAVCGRRPFVGQARLRRADGEWRWLESHAEPRFSSGGEFLGHVGVSSDVTERRRAEEALRAANHRLAEADRLKNEFLAMLSHELRNPLAPIRSGLYVVEHGRPGSEQVGRALEVISRQTGQLVRLVDDLLDVTRITRNKIRIQRRQLDLGDLVRRALEDHHPLFQEKGILVEAEIAPDRLPVDGDEARLAQVIGNLLQNAAKFTPPGGRVRVVTRMRANRAGFRITDNGAGMTAEMLARLFQPFTQADVTLDRSKGGLGLGLVLVKGLVEMHGGEVCAHSDGPGKGAEFVVELPLDPKAAGETGEEPAAGARRRRRVLIIEDNVDAADSLRVALELIGHVADVAYNGAEGLAKAREFRPEVVLCDIGLPEMDGFEVARALRADEAFSGIALVALSGYALPEDLNRAAEAGFHRHLAKPPSIEALDQLLSDLPDTLGP